ncbi:MAG: hypothetical protein KJP09_09020 [Bacteroidia bacterium]|nr:hypothetical protein [Bacteroidia bacterium]MBT8310838.1 hypothetical protein [Bacteroidia bacterium]NND10210.1 hypothetical protein [Flavobacteriaceae bacterium]NNK28667.1 hypothetical protein [Flavobacteriaceae bacterium]NNL60471.1 hypothetical protein [Flavobacteriaceae bacterium]
MKNLKPHLTLLLVFLAFNISTAQITTKIYPKRGVVVTKIHKPKIIVHKNKNLYWADGIWYKRNQGKYIVVNAPAGIAIKRLPRGHKVVRINGRKYYKYRGIVYKKQRRNYVVVTV